MSKYYDFWLNIDKMNRVAVLHKASCKYAIEKGETDFVGVGQFKRDGGWFGFNKRMEARNFVRQEVGNNFQFKDCNICF